MVKRYAAILMVLAFCLGGAFAAPPTGCPNATFDYGRPIVITDTQTWVRVNSPVKMNISGMKLNTNNCSLDFALYVYLTGARVPFKITNNTGQAGENGTQWCNVTFEVNDTSTTGNNQQIVYACYGNNSVVSAASFPTISQPATDIARDTGMTVLGSSTGWDPFEGHLVANAIDGVSAWNDVYVWTGANVTANITIDLGRNKTISRFDSEDTCHDVAGITFPGRTDLFYSTDNSTYRLLTTNYTRFTGNTVTKNITFGYSTSPTSARWWRVSLYTNFSDFYTPYSEMYVYDDSISIPLSVGAIGAEETTTGATDEPPTVSLLAPPNNTKQTGLALTVNVSAADDQNVNCLNVSLFWFNGSFFETKSNCTTYNNNTGINFTFTAFPVSSKGLVFANTSDNATNSASTGNYTVYLDDTPPVITLSFVNGTRYIIKGSDIILNGTCTDSVSGLSGCWPNLTQFGGIASFDTDGTFAWVNTSALANATNYTFRISANDTLGNTNTADGWFYTHFLPPATVIVTHNWTNISAETNWVKNFNYSGTITVQCNVADCPGMKLYPEWNNTAQLELPSAIYYEVNDSFVNITDETRLIRNYQNHSQVYWFGRQSTGYNAQLFQREITWNQLVAYQQPYADNGIFSNSSAYPCVLDLHNGTIVVYYGNVTTDVHLDWGVIQNYDITTFSYGGTHLVTFGNHIGNCEVFRNIFNESEYVWMIESYFGTWEIRPYSSLSPFSGLTEARCNLNYINFKNDSSGNSFASNGLGTVWQSNNGTFNLIVHAADSGNEPTNIVSFTSTGYNDYCNWTKGHLLIPHGVAGSPTESQSANPNGFNQNGTTIILYTGVAGNHGVTMTSRTNSSPFNLFIKNNTWYNGTATNTFFFYNVTGTDLYYDLGDMAAGESKTIQFNVNFTEPNQYPRMRWRASSTQETNTSEEYSLVILTDPPGEANPPTFGTVTGNPNNNEDGTSVISVTINEANFKNATCTISNSTGSFNFTATNSSGNHTCTFAAGTFAPAHATYYIQFSAYDAYENFGQSDNQSFVVPNQKPSAPTASDMIPTTAYKDSILWTQGSASTDADNADTVSYYAKWNTSQGATLSNWKIYAAGNASFNCSTSASCNKSVTVTACIMASDSYDNSTNVACKSKAISNSLPTVPTASAITPSTAYKASTLSSTPSASTDTDGDAINYYVKWNTSLGATLSAFQLNASTGAQTFDCTSTANCNKSVTITVCFVANDGTANSTGVACQNRAISNTAPTAPTAGGISPNPAYKVGILSAASSGSTDVDTTDIIGYYHKWNTSAGATLENWNLNTTTGNQEFDCTPAANCNKSATVTFCTIATDTYANSTTVSCSDRIISNTAPTLGAPSVNNTAPNLDMEINCGSGAYYDADSDSGSFSYLWYHNDSELWYGQTILLNASFSIGSTLKCSQNATDGTAVTAWVNSSNSATIAATTSTSTSTTTTTVISTTTTTVISTTTTAAYYPSPNIYSFTDFFAYMNTVTGGLAMTLIWLSFWLALFLGIKQVMTTEAAIPLSSFAATVVGYLLAGAGLISNKLVLIALMATAAGAFI